MKKILIASLAVLSLSACQPEPEVPEVTLEQIKAAQMKPDEVNIEQIPQAREQHQSTELTAEVMRKAKYVDLKPVGAPTTPAPAAEAKAPSNTDTAP